MSNCTSSCDTQDHESYGECLRQNSPMFVAIGSISQQKAKDNELDSYFSAIKQGIEPRSTNKKDIDQAVKLSNEAGKAFDGVQLKFRN